VIRHTVQRGDTLISIAASNGSSVDAIRAANRLDSDLLSVGQVLLVPVGSWTATPTATQVPDITATPTSQFLYTAPDLLSPPNRQTIRGADNAPMLSWTSPATLKPGEFYIVHIERLANGSHVPQPALTVTQGNSVRVPKAYYGGTSGTGTQYTWYVVVVAEPKGASEPAAAQSPPSATWTFTWY
jgi:murein DD-endopeptidase MepM/ murein hydrolase activator NlpD